MSNQKNSKKFKIGKYESVAITLVIVMLFMIGYNSVKINAFSGGSTDNFIIPSVSASEIIPLGVPNIYGEELEISYNDVSPSDPRLADKTIEIMSNIDRSTTLEGDDLDRYIRIVTQISCEYCCGAESIIFNDGKSACGCAHSYAMRGLAKYLITEHGNEFTDDEILMELGKWKVLFFPGIHETKASVLKSKGIDTGYISLTSNQNRGIEKGQSSSSEMVGGC
ncbi:hypothetical protein GOV12_04125 [Candidatus Pacearchaeota archaeon]|nr:hypothetical protein [Candidatus Pacearchaeota archaeon]